jgi:hypothetical protein
MSASTATTKTIRINRMHAKVAPLASAFHPLRTLEQRAAPRRYCLAGSEMKARIASIVALGCSSISQ